VIDEMTEGVEERKRWNLPSDKKIFLFQGAGINIDRGAEEAIEAIRKVENAVLLFVGAGDVIEKIQKQNQAESKIFFIPKQPMKELIRFTRMADFGLTLDKDTNLNYKYSLPNKLFDYIRAGLPVIATDLPEVSRIVKSYDVGIVIPSAEPSILSSAMIKMMGDQNKIDSWKKNANIAAMELCWEKEEKKFLEIINDALAT
jgi:glycosyltransferase involved in cell wall biosynthesis